MQNHQLVIEFGQVYVDDLSELDDKKNYVPDVLYPETTCIGKSSKSLE